MLKHTFAALALVVFFAAPALAGPPLICHPFDTESGSLLAWGNGPGWNTPDPSYDIRRLVADTTAVLAPATPVLTRMENLRRAAIYSMRDPVIAEQLLKALMARALRTTTDAGAWFDAGYLIEAHRQGTHLRQRSASWAAVDETIRVDGYGFVKKAMAMSGPNAAMEFAASLMTEGPAAAAHRARAATAGPGSLVVRNLAKLAY
jgi:hypothetical protein